MGRAGAHAACVAPGRSRRGAARAVALGRYLPGGATHGARRERRSHRPVRRLRPHARFRPRPPGRQRAARRSGQQRDRRPPRHPLQLPALPRARRFAADRAAGRQRTLVHRHARRRRRLAARQHRAGCGNADPDSGNLLPVRRGGAGRADALRRHR